MKNKQFDSIELMLFFMLGIFLGIFIGTLSITSTKTTNTQEVVFEEKFIIGTMNDMFLVQEEGNVLVCPIQYSSRTCENLMSYEEFQKETGYFR